MSLYENFHTPGSLRLGGGGNISHSLSQKSVFGLEYSCKLARVQAAPKV